MSKKNIVQADFKKVILTQEELQELKYFREIKLVWTSNRSHCSNNNYKSVRVNYLEKDIAFCDEWNSCMLGFLRFYIWMIEHNYIPRKTILRRINPEMGFSPDNCMVIEKPKPKSEGKKAKYVTKSTTVEAMVEIKDPLKPANMLNNLTLSEDKKLAIQLLFGILGIQLLDEQVNVNVNQLVNALKK